MADRYNQTVVNTTTLRQTVDDEIMKDLTDTRPQILIRQPGAVGLLYPVPRSWYNQAKHADPSVV